MTFFARFANKKNAGGVKPRRLQLESLEARELLSATSTDCSALLAQPSAAETATLASADDDYESVCSAVASACATDAADALESGVTSVNGATIKRMSETSDRWSVDFALDEQNRGVLFGLSYEDAYAVAAGEKSWDALDYCDANKPTKATDPEAYALVSKHCWSATAANMLTYAGWTDGLTFESEQDVFEYFTTAYANSSGNVSYACDWFVFGDRDRYASVSDHDAGGFYTDQAASYGESGSDYVSWDLYNLADTVDGMTALANDLASGKAVGFDVDWVRNSNGEYSGGHTLTCWGYCYDPTFDASDVDYYTSVFVTDSDDGATALKNYAIEWSETAELDETDYFAGYVFTSYTPKSAYHGFLSEYAVLSARPDKYEITTTQDVRSATPEGWDGPVVVSTDPESTQTQELIEPGENVYVRYAFEALEDVDDVFACRLYLDGTLVQELNFSALEGGTICTNLSNDGLAFDLGVVSEGAHEVKITLDSFDEVGEYRESNNVLCAAFNVGSDADPYEPNNSRSSAYDLGALTGTTSIAAVADASKKYDYYKFTLESDATIADRIELRTAADVDDTIVVFLYDASGAVLNQTRLCDGCAQLPLGVAAGVYYVALFNSTSTEEIPYTLSYIKSGADLAEKLPLTSVTLNSVDPEYGQKLVASVAAGETASYQWYRGSDDAGWTAIDGAVGASYKVALADVGQSLKVVATGVGRYAGEVSAATNVAACEVKTAVFNKAGTEPVIGTKIFSYITSGTNTVYRWVRVDSEGNETTIEGATERSYTPQHDDYGFYLKLYATGINGFYGTATKQTANVVAKPKVVSVDLLGTARVGKYLTARGNPLEATVTYQWYRGSEEDGWTAIDGASKRVYYPTAADAGLYLRVVATGYGDYEGEVYNTTESYVTIPLSYVSITQSVGMNATIRSYVVSSAATVEYQWYRGSDDDGWTAIDGATSANYTLVYADSDKYVKVVVTGVGSYSGVVSKTTKNTFHADFSASLSNDSPAYCKTIQASAAPTKAACVWQWYRVSEDGVETAIEGATSAKYTATAADVGFYLKAVATGTGAYETAVASVQTTNVVSRALTSIALTRNAKVGVAIRAYLTPGAGTASYQWYVGDDENGWTAIEGATASSYVPTLSDAGQCVKVVATGYGAYYGAAEKSAGVVAGLVDAALNDALAEDDLDLELDAFWDSLDA